MYLILEGEIFVGFLTDDQGAQQSSPIDYFKHATDLYMVEENGDFRSGMLSRISNEESSQNRIDHQYGRYISFNFILDRK